MRKHLFLPAFLLFFCSSCASEQADSPPEEEIDYQKSPNFNAQIAIFGASFTRIEASDVCKQYWQQQLNITWTDFGINGAGYSNLPQDPGVQYEIDRWRERQQTYDIYLLWSPTHDFYKSVEIGSLADYTEADGYDRDKLQTLLGGMNYCYRNITEVHPEAQILLFTTLPVFNWGTDGYEADGLMQRYVDAQIAWARQHNVCYLDLFRCSGFTHDNYGKYYEQDALHPSSNGYDHLKELTARFIAYPGVSD